MLEDFQEQQRKKLTRVKSTMDTTMGIILVLFGIFFLLVKTLNIRIVDREPSQLDYFIGGLFVLYGSWRIYRGYKKNYFE